MANSKPEAINALLSLLYAAVTAGSEIKVEIPMNSRIRLTLSNGPFRFEPLEFDINVDPETDTWYVEG